MMATTKDITDERFAQAILNSIREEIVKIADEEAAAAADRVMKRTKARVNEFAVALIGHFSVERFGPELRITVKHEGTNA